MSEQPTPIAAFTHELGRLFIEGKQREADKLFPDTPRSFIVHQADGHVFKVEVHHLYGAADVRAVEHLSAGIEREDHPLAASLVSDHSGLE